MHTLFLFVPLFEAFTFPDVIILYYVMLYTVKQARTSLIPDIWSIIGIKKKTHKIKNNLNPEWNEVIASNYCYRLPKRYFSYSRRNIIEGFDNMFWTKWVPTNSHNLTNLFHAQFWFLDSRIRSKRQTFDQEWTTWYSG